MVRNGNTLDGHNPVQVEPKSKPELLDVKIVAQLLSCSTRHVYRLVGASRMPPPVKLGALVRWPRRTILDWISSGCRPWRTEPLGANRE